MRKVAAGAEGGQALVLVLLSLAVVLTIVLFVLARSVTDIAVSSRSEEAVRAFSAAEAGIENALVIGVGSSSTTIGNASYSSSVTGFAEGLTDFNYPLPMSSGDSMTTWFVSHDANGNFTCADGKCFTGSSMKVCWGKPGTDSSTATTPAVEVSVFYETAPGSLSSIQIGRITSDPNSGRAATNKFSGVDGACSSISGGAYAFQKTINFADIGILPGSYNTQNGLQFARIRILYNTDQTQPVGVTVSGSGGLLPSQGSDIVSTGTAGQSNRKVEVYQGWPEPPSVFDAAIFGSSGLVKSISSSAPPPASVPTAGAFGASVADRTITITYSDISAPTTTDWVGFYAPGDPDSAFVDWMYIHSSGTCTKDPGDGVASGSCQFAIPPTILPGTYDVRLFSNDSYIKIASTSLDIASPPPATLSASATSSVINISYADIPSPTTTDWVGVYNPGDADNASLSWVYVRSSGVCTQNPGDGVASGSCQFDLPASVPPGDYEARLFSNNGFTKLATSAFVVPTPPPTPTPSPTEAPTPLPTETPTEVPTPTP